MFRQQYRGRGCKVKTMINKRFIVFVLVALSSHLFGQNVAKHFTDKDNIGTHLALMGDTIIMDCDSITLMNEKTYNTYQKLMEKNIDSKKLFDEYKAIQDQRTNDYENQIKLQKEDYNRLHGLMNSLIDSSMNFANATKTDLIQISDSLVTVAKFLQEAKDSIQHAQSNVKAARRKKILENFGWAIGGVATGALITAVVFLVVPK